MQQDADAGAIPPPSFPVSCVNSRSIVRRLRTAALRDSAATVAAPPGAACTSDAKRGPAGRGSSGELQPAPRDTARQLIEQHTNQARVRRHAPIERTEAADVQDQLAQQPRDVERTAARRGSTAATRGARYSVRTETGANICSVCATPGKQNPRMPAGRDNPARFAR